MNEKHREYVLKHGRAVYETWTPNPDNCVAYDGVEYVGHRLGQAWAWQNHPEVPVTRMCKVIEGWFSGI